jgi:hypothetical protein
VAGDPVLDAAGVIVVFRLRVYDARFAFVQQRNFQHWGVADQSCQTIKFFRHFFIYHHGQKTSHTYVMSFFVFSLTLLPRKDLRQPIHKKYKIFFWKTLDFIFERVYYSYQEEPVSTMQRSCSLSF